MQLSKAVEGYIIAALAEGYSQLTLAAYRSALNTMQEFIGDKEVSDITTEDLRGFMNYLVTDYSPERRNNPSNTEPLSTASHHRYWKAMRSFFKWAERDLDVGRPDLSIKMPAWESKTIIPFTEDEIKALLKCSEYAQVPSGKRQAYQFHRPNALRDKALILTLLDTGVRVGELTRIRVGDVNLENGEVFIRPFHVKKTHSRTTYLGKVARKALWRYLVERDNTRPDMPLFVTNENRPMTRQRVLSLLSNLGKSSGILKVHPHRFRHTMAVQYLRNGGDIFTLQRILGHRRLEMVNRYLYIVSADVKSAHQRASPADNWRL
jgi:integrase/recombinase XerD